MASFLRVATILSIGLMIGVELAVWLFINPVLWKLEDPLRPQAVRLFARRLGAAMPFWYSLNFLLLAAEAVLLRHEPGATLIYAAIGIWVVVIVLTLVFLVPINNRLAREDAGLPAAEAHREHLRWDSRHRVRVIALAAAMVLFLLAIRA
jgi:uncharacterized membrane protein